MLQRPLLPREDSQEAGCLPWKHLKANLSSFQTTMEMPATPCPLFPCSFPSLTRTFSFYYKEDPQCVCTCVCSYGTHPHAYMQLNSKKPALVLKAGKYVLAGRKIRGDTANLRGFRLKKKFLLSSAREQPYISAQL